MPILANREMVSCTRRVPLTMVLDAHLAVITVILLIPATSVVMQMVYGSQATLRVKVLVNSFCSVMLQANIRIII